jgi:hypothetical protein
MVATDGKYFSFRERLLKAKAVDGLFGGLKRHSPTMAILPRRGRSLTRPPCRPRTSEHPGKKRPRSRGPRACGLEGRQGPLKAS